MPDIRTADKSVTDTSWQPPPWLRHILQLLGSFGVLLLASVALLPPYHFGVAVQYGDCDTLAEAVVNYDNCQWVPAPWSRFLVVVFDRAQ